VIFDIDHFKSVNDTYGHQFGDDVIRMVAQITREHARESDFAGRYGGEEFVVLLPDTDLQGAAHFAERLRKAIETRALDFQGQPKNFTVSLGVASLEPEMQAHQQLIEKADQALYRSKESGRNRTTLACE